MIFSKPRVLLVAVVLVLAGATAIRKGTESLDAFRARREALLRCAEWGVVDIGDFGGPYSKQWMWAPGVRQPHSDPAELGVLLEKSAIPYLTAAAEKDPSDRLRVAALGVLVTMAERRAPGWFDEGGYHDACWRLLRAFCAPQTGGTNGGPESYGLLIILRNTVARDRTLGLAMARELVRKMGEVDAWSALCFGTALWQSGLGLEEYGDMLTESVRDGRQPRAVACACVLVQLNADDSDGRLEHMLRDWLVTEPGAVQVQRAIEHLERSKQR